MRVLGRGANHCTGVVALFLQHDREMRHPLVVLSLLTIPTLTACRGTEPTPEPSADGDLQQEPVVIDLEPWVGDFLTIRAVVGGRAVRLLFDTGGGETLIAPRVFGEQGCVFAGRAVGFRMSGEQVHWPRCRGLPIVVGGVVFEPTTVGEFDIMELIGPQLPPEVPTVDGVFSLDAGRGQLLTLDLAASTLTVETGGSFAARIATMQEVVARVATGPDGGSLTLFVRATIQENGAVAWLLMDSGNAAGLLLDPAVAPAGDSSSVHLDLGGPILLRSRAQRADLIYDGALSARDLQGVVVAMDLGAGRAWMRSTDPR